MDKKNVELINSCIEIRNDQKIYSCIEGILHEDTVLLYEKINKSKEELYKKYNKEDVDNYINDYYFELPILIRQKAYNGESLQSLINSCIFYRNLSIDYLKKNNIESAEESLKSFKNHKVAAIYKYSIEEYEKEMNEQNNLVKISSLEPTSNVNFDQCI